MSAHPMASHAIVLYVRSKLDELVAVVPKAQRELLTGESILYSLQQLLAADDDDKPAKLRDCIPASVYDSLMAILRLGLDPAPGRGQAFLIPRAKVCTHQIGAQGKIELAYRSGFVAKITCNVVYDSDHFMCDLANGVMEHTVDLTVSQGKPMGAYARVWLKGSPDPMDELLRPRDFETIKTKAARGGTSPAWKDYETEMWRRSVLNRALKRVPKSPALAEAMADDALVAMAETPATDGPPTTSTASAAASPDEVEARLRALQCDADPPFANGAGAGAASEMP